MERLMELARKQAEAVTVYGESRTHDQVGFEDGRLKTVDSALSSGVALTVVKDGKQGFAYTRNLIDREGLVRDAVAALAGGVEAAGDLPQPEKLPVLATAAEQSGGNALLADECRRVTDYLSGRVKGQVNVGADRAAAEVRVLTSSGVDARVRSTEYSAIASVMYPGSYSGIRRVVSAKGFEPFPESDLSFIVETYNASQNPVRPPSGRTRALLLPEGVIPYTWRLATATDAQYLYEKVSPLCGRIGEPVLSKLITLTNDPLDDRLPGARAFDDEGTPCRSLRVFDHGVFGTFYNDRLYAMKTGAEPTGNGYRGGPDSPSPSLQHLALAPGTHTFEQLLRSLGTGLIVAGFMGAHSGNILNGDYSIGLSPGLWVDGGAIVGVVKDAMVSGNVYEDLKSVVAVGDTVYDAFGGRYPAVLLEGVSFTTRG
jgi:PmbA protein